MKTAFCLALLLFCSGCFHSQKSTIDPKMTALAKNPALANPRIRLSPVGNQFDEMSPPVIRGLGKNDFMGKRRFRVGDKIVFVNKKRTKTIKQVREALLGAPIVSTFKVRRKNKYYLIKVRLKDYRPKLDLGFEPNGIALVKPRSPKVTYMRKKGMTVYALASIDKVTKELQVNVIVDSDKKIPATRAKLAIYKKGRRKPIARTQSLLQSLGQKSSRLKKSVQLSSLKTAPLVVSLKVAKKKFNFEFK